MAEGDRSPSPPPTDNKQLDDKDKDDRDDKDDRIGREEREKDEKRDGERESERGKGGGGGGRKGRKERSKREKRQQQQQQQQQQQGGSPYPCPRYREQWRRGDEWTDSYTQRRMRSRAFGTMNDAELNALLERLKRPTISSNGAVELRDKKYEYTKPVYNKTNPEPKRQRPQTARSETDRAEIVDRLYSAKTHAWVARRKPNPNTRVHESSDFTIV